MIRVLTVILCCWAATASAEVVTLKSGEHDGFTRIVFYYPETANWQMDTSNNRAIVRFGSAVSGIDYSDVFPYIRRDRLRNISVASNGRTATLSLACPCDPRAWQHSSGIMVIDIYDTEGSHTRSEAWPRLRYALSDADSDFPPSIAAGAIDRFAYNASERLDRFAIGVRLPARPRQTPTPRAQIQPPAQTQTRTASSQSTPNQTDSAASNPTPDDMLGLFRRERVSEAQQRLMEQIIRGVAQGSLRADFDPNLYAPPEEAPAPIAEPIETEIVSLSPEPTPAREELPLRAETSFDRDSAIADEALRARGCVPNSDLNFTGMVVADRFTPALAEARANQANATGAARIEADETLAVTYLYWGFGAEAIQTVRSSDIEPERAAQLIAQAEIIDHGYATNPLGLAAHPACDGPAAFWSLMAPETWPDGFRINPQHVLSTFNALPPHLRRQLGQKLVERLIDADAIDVAQEVQRILMREQPDPSPSMQLSGARIALAGGDTELSEEELASIARSGTDEAALALLDLTDLMLSREELLPDDLIELLAAYGFENRNTPLSDRLIANRALGIARRGDLRTALKIADDELSDTDNYRSTLEGIYHFATQYGADEPFLRLALSRVKDDIDKLNPIANNDVARRLLTLGFPDQALFFLESEATGPEGMARQLLRAEAALQLKNPGEVEIALLGLESETARRLRAEAKAMLADHDHAYVAFSALGARQEAERQAMLGRDWARLTESEDDVLRRAAEIIANQDAPETDAGLPSLARSRALIEGSESARDAFGDLILRFAPRDEF